MKLPISIFKNEKYYNEIRVKEPTPKVLSEVQMYGSKDDIAGSFIALISGCTESIVCIDGKEITDPLAIKSLIRFIPYRSAECIATKLMLLIDDNDFVEGVYVCPRCEEKIVTECQKDEQGNIVFDNRDKVSDMDIKYADEKEITFVVELDKAVEIKEKANGKVIASAEMIEFFHPTLDHYSKASMRTSKSNPIQTQYAIYAYAMKTIDNEVVEEKDKHVLGLKIIENLPSIKDLRKINDGILRYGYNTKVEKHCKNCGKIYNAEVNTSGFFASALRLN